MGDTKAGENVYPNAANSIYFSKFLFFQQSPPPATEVELAFSTSFAVGIWIYHPTLADGSRRKACYKAFQEIIFSWIKKGE